MHPSIAGRRLLNQRIVRPLGRRPADVVSWFGAVQAQDYDAATWGLGLRTRDGTAADVARAFDRGRILRLHVMRPTWHFVTPADIRWLVELTAPRVQQTLNPYWRRMGLDAPVRARATAVIQRALADGQHLTRGELGARLARAGLVLDRMRLAHVAMHAELEGVVCSGPRRGKQFTYALVAERAPGAPRLSRDEALATLVHRYFRSHGPATARDFAWWSGLTTADARRGLEMVRARSEERGGRVYWTAGPSPRQTTRADPAHLLPIYDEYLVAYRDREAVPHGPPVVRSPGGWVTFRHALVIAGQVAGTWTPRRSPEGFVADVTPARRLTGPERRAVAAACERYARFVGNPGRQPG